MLLSAAANCQLVSSRPVAVERYDIVVVMWVYRHAGQVASVRQELDVAAERLLVSSVALRHRRR